MGMLDRSPEASLRVFRKAASAKALTSPRRRARRPKSMFLNALDSFFFIDILQPVTSLAPACLDAKRRRPSGNSASGSKPCYGKSAAARLSNAWRLIDDSFSKEIQNPVANSLALLSH